MSDWKGLISLLAKVSTPYPHLKPAYLGQWMLETGRGTSRAFREYWNLGGLKWRPEMEGFATKVWYATPTEPFRAGPNGWEQGDWFCKFADADAAVKGYFQFLSRAPYKGWEKKTTTAMDFLGFIGPTYCPGGYSEKWIAEHGGLNYHSHIVETLYPEALELLKAEGWSLTPASGGATWFEANRYPTGVAVISALDENGRVIGNLVGSPALAVLDIKAFFDKHPKGGTLLVAHAGEKPVGEPVTPPEGETPAEPTPLPLEGRRILVAPGHSEKNSGAFGKGPNPPSEYELNALQGSILVERLRAAGAFVRLHDPANDVLRDDALQANGFDLYLVPHHNSEDKDNKNDEGSETWIHPLADAECRKLAQMIQTAIVKELKTLDRGVKEGTFTVLSVATRETNCKLNILPESYFVDDYTSKEITRDRSTRAAHAMADAVVAYFSGVDVPDVEQPGDIVIATPWTGNRDFKRGENIWLSKNFHLSEFECNCGCGITKVDGKHVQDRQRLRDRVGRPVRINSGYRCPAYNKKIGGADDSQHIYGRASDITVDNVAPSAVYSLADTMFDGVGKYATFTHIDSRGYRARWNG